MCGSMNGSNGFRTITHEELVQWINSTEKSVVIDGRPFMEYNTNKIMTSINVNCSKLVKRRLQQNKLCIMELLGENLKVPDLEKIVVYDDQTESPTHLTSDHFLYVLLSKLSQKFKDVRLLKGGFLQFYSNHPSLCECVAGSALSVEGRQRTSSSSGPTVGNADCAMTPNQPLLTSLSQPTMPVPEGPTKILPHVYIGSEEDAMSTETLARHGITHVLNVSRACQWRKDYVPSSHFLRIAVDDNHSERLLPHFTVAFRFMDKVKQANGRVLVHCLAGISRSPTCVIAYLMKTQSLPFEKAYRYVKERRAQISPNFNFLGQLAQFEGRLKKADDAASPCTPLPDFDNCPFVRLASMRRKLAEREAAAAEAGRAAGGSKQQSPSSSPASPPPPPATSHSPDERLSLRSGLQRELSLPGSMVEALEAERAGVAGSGLGGRGISPHLGDRGLCSCHVAAAEACQLSVVSS